MEKNAVLMKIDQILEKVYDAEAMYFALLQANPELEDEDRFAQPWFSPLEGDLDDLRKDVDRL